MHKACANLFCDFHFMSTNMLARYFHMVHMMIYFEQLDSIAFLLSFACHHHFSLTSYLYIFYYELSNSDHVVI